MSKQKINQETTVIVKAPNKPERTDEINHEAAQASVASIAYEQNSGVLPELLSREQQFSLEEGAPSDGGGLAPLSHPRETEFAPISTPVPTQVDSPSAQPNSTPINKDQIDLLFKTIQRFDFYINSTNTKAALLSAFNTFLVGSSITKWNELIRMFDGTRKAEALANILLVVFSLGCLLSMALALRVVYPLFVYGPHDGLQSFIFFEHVAANKTPKDYRDKFLLANNSLLLTDLASQSFDLATVLKKKFSDLRTAIRLSICSLSVLGLLFLLKLAATLLPHIFR